MSIPSFQSGLIDRKRRDFDKLEIEFDNLANDGSSSFPFTQLEAGQNLEDAKVFVYAYSPTAADGVLLWWGWTQGRFFDGKQKKFKLSASFFWESFDISIPYVQIQQKGFSLNQSSGKTNANDDDQEFFIPLVYGVANPTIRPLIYNHWVEGSTLKVEFILSGTHNGLPFGSSDITAANFKLGPTPASVIEFYPGNQSSAPANLTRFPENQVHPLVAFGYAEFPITDESKSVVDDLKPGAIKAKVANGRPLVDLGIASENPVRILKDLLRDPVFGFGLPDSAFDAAAITAAANYVAPRYQVLYNLKKTISLMELVQQILGDCHCYITFENGLIQINAKRNNETSVATFATCDSGQSGRKVEDDYSDVGIKDSSELVNQVTREFRVKSHPRRVITLYDPTAQARAGGTVKKPVTDDVDTGESGGLYDETQNQINAAIILREEQNGNLFPSFSSPFWDSLDITPGDVVTIRTVDIFSNTINKEVRITKKVPDANAGVIRFESQIYKQAIYNDDAIALGVDLLRGGEDMVIPGRPPDITPVSLTLQDVVTNDTEGRQFNARATFTVPPFDPATEQADGIFREAPISEVEIRWRYTDEPISAARPGNSLPVRQTASAQTLFIDFQGDYRKSKTIEAFFISVAPNRSRAQLGYIPDTTKTSTIRDNPNFSATDFNLDIASVTPFLVNDYIIIEKEIDRVSAIIGPPTNVLVLANNGSARTPQFDTVAIAHPLGTEVAVAKQSYPSLTLSLVTPRFTYPVVTGLAARPQGDSVRFKWNDPTAENKESFLLYWSTDADALTNASKLGSATPAWYLADPLSPPAGVNLSINDDLQHKVHQADAGGAGVVVKARVAARNGKRNFSSALSSSAQDSSTGTTVPDTTVPATPAAPTIIPHTSKVKVKGAKPANNINFFIKQEIVARVKNGSGTVLGFIIDGNPPTNNATEFKNNILADWNHTFHWNKSDILSLYPTAATIEFYTYVTNEIGTSAASPVATLTVSTWQADSIIQDSAVTSSPSAPTVIPHTSKVKIKCAKPATNFNQFLNNAIVARVKNGAGTILGYIVDSTSGPTNNGTEFKNNLNDDINHTFHWNKSAILALHPTAATIEFYNYITNGAGEGAASAATALTVSTWQADSIIQDTAVVVAPAAPTLIPRSRKIKVKTVKPTSNFNQFVKNEIAARVKNGSGTILGYIVDATTGAALSAVEVFNDLGPDINHTFNWTKSEIVALFPTGATIEFYNRITNGFGVSASGSAQSMSISSWEVDPLDKDAGAPNNLPTPRFYYRRGKLHAKLDMSGVTNVNGPYSVQLSVNDGTNSMNLDSLSDTAFVSGIQFYHFGSDTAITIPTSLQQLQLIFGPSALLRCAFKLTNLAGATTSVNSASLSALTGLTDYSPRSGGYNELWNGDFTNDDGAASDTLGNWQQWKPTNGTLNGISTSTSAGRWDQANHLFFWRQNDSSTNKRYLTQNLFKTIVRGDFKSWSFFLSSNSSLTATVDVFLAALFDLTGTVSINGTTTVTGSGTSFLTELKVNTEVAINNEIRIVQSITDDTHFVATSAFSTTASGQTCHAAVPQSNIVPIGSRTYGTTETYVEMTVQVDSDAFTDKDIHLCFRTSTTISTSGPFLRVGRVMQVTGKTPVQFARKVIVERNTSTTGLSGGSPVASENLSFVPTGGLGGDRQEGSGDPPEVGGAIIF